MLFPAIFMPSSNPADAGLMTAQVAFNKVRVGNLLGTSGWYGRDFLVNAKKQAEGSVFSIAFYSDGNEQKFFTEKFKSKWQRDPDENKVAGLSYDAIRIVNQALQSLAQSENPQSLPVEILQKREYKGVYGKIILADNGANKNTGLISVEQGKLVEKSPWCEVSH